MTPMWRCNVITALHHFARYLHRVMAERGGSPAVHCSQSNWPRSQSPDWSRSTSQGSKIWVKLVDDIRSSPQIGRIPANTRRWPDVGLMMVRRLRRRSIINSTMGQRLVLVGDPPIYVPSRFDNTLVDHDATCTVTQDVMIAGPTCAWGWPTIQPLGVFDGVIDLLSDIKEVRRRA